MIAPRIKTDPVLLAALGTDGAAWASAYLKQQRHFDGDARHIELAAWFDAAIGGGAKGERTKIADGLARIADDWPMRASDISVFLNADQFDGFIAIWTRGDPESRKQAVSDWSERAERDNPEDDPANDIEF